MWIEPWDYAPTWLQNYVALQWKKDVEPKAVCMFRVYDADPVKFPTLRDRSVEMRKIIRGLAMATINDELCEYEVTGADLHKAEVGYTAVGAGFLHKFVIMAI